jgi:hypothetical protein
MKRSIFLIAIFIAIKARCNDIDSSKVEFIFNSAISMIDHKIGVGMDFSDSSVYGSFDFEEFQPKNDTTNKEDSYVVYYKRDKIVGIKHLINGVQDYLLSVHHSDRYIYYTAFVFKTFERKFGVMAEGVFVYDKKYKTNLFFKIDHRAIYPPIYEVNRNTVIDLKENVKVNDVLIVFKLDKNLDVVSRINYFNCELVSFSFVHKELEGYSETMSVYANRTCEGESALDKMSLETLLYYLNDDMCDEGFMAKVKANHIKGTPYWSIDDYGYSLE